VVLSHGASRIFANTEKGSAHMRGGSAPAVESVEEVIRGWRVCLSTSRGLRSQ
jgi:hypothetical protein